VKQESSLRGRMPQIILYGIDLEKLKDKKYPPQCVEDTEADIFLGK
jgi:hypothetical protein